MQQDILAALLGMAGGPDGPDGPDMSGLPPGLLDGMQGLLGPDPGRGPRVGISGNTGPTQYTFSISFDPGEDDDVTYGRLEEACATILHGVGVELDDLPFAKVLAKAMVSQIRTVRAADE